MTAPVRLEPKLSSPIIPKKWTTVAAGVADTTVDGGGSDLKVVVSASTGPDSLIELRVATSATDSGIVEVIPAGSLVEMQIVLPGGETRVALEARTTVGLGALQITNLGVLIGTFADTVAALFVTAQADRTVDEGDSLLFTAPTHNGDQIFLERSFDSGVSWASGGALNKSPADPSDDGDYRWRVVRAGDTDVTTEFTVTVTETVAAPNPTTIQQPPQNQTAAVGSSARFEARAFGESDLTWAWQEYNGTTWAFLGPETGSGPVAVLDLGPLSSGDDGRLFRVQFNSVTAADSVDSAAAALTVDEPAPADGPNVTDMGTPQ